MLSTINIDAAKSAIQTKYTRTVATNGIVPVSLAWTSQAGLNALVNKATEVLIGLLIIKVNDTDNTNSATIGIIDFAVTTIDSLTRTNMSINSNSVLMFGQQLYEFSDMGITMGGGSTLYCMFQGWKFTFV